MGDGRVLFEKGQCGLSRDTVALDDPIGELVAEDDPDFPDRAGKRVASVRDIMHNATRERAELMRLHQIQFGRADDFPPNTHGFGAEKHHGEFLPGRGIFRDFILPRLAIQVGVKLQGFLITNTDNFRAHQNETSLMCTLQCQPAMLVESNFHFGVSNLTVRHVYFPSALRRECAIVGAGLTYLNTASTLLSITKAIRPRYGQLPKK